MDLTWHSSIPSRTSLHGVVPAFAEGRLGMGEATLRNLDQTTRARAARKPYAIALPHTGEKNVLATLVLSYIHNPGYAHGRQAG